MKRFLYLVLILLLSLPFSGLAQIMDSQFQEFYDDFEHLKKFNERKEVSYDGTPYLNDDFIPGNIFLTEGKEYNSILLRYNIYYDQFEFSRDGKTFAIEQDPDLVKISLGDRVFKLDKYEYKGETGYGYLEQVLEGEYSLYIKHVTILRDGEDSGAYKQATKPTFYPQKPVFLIGDSNDRIVEIKSSKDFLNEFSELEESIEEYTGNKKLKLKNQDDYIELVSYLNTMSD